jgi:hypothetical protein
MMLLEPPLTPVARPERLMVAAAGLAEVHVTELLRFCVLPSPKVPIAVN